MFLKIVSKKDIGKCVQ
jgi:hypothetical protein